MMKDCMRKVNPVFNTNRMVAEYNDRFYVPADKRYGALSDNDRQRARELAAWLDNVRNNWKAIRIEHVEANGSPEHHVGDLIEVKARVNLAGLKASDVLVQVFYGQMKSEDDVRQGDILDLKLVKQEGSIAEFRGGIPLTTSGKMGLAVRLLPSHADLVHPLLTGHILWAHS